MWNPLKFRRSYAGGVLFLEGTDSWDEWWHHILPGARRREIRKARELAEVFWVRPDLRAVSGHSMGGCVADIAAKILEDEFGKVVGCYVAAPKRPPRGWGSPRTVAYYRRGDLLHWVWPWRPKPAKVVVFGARTDPISAHMPEAYREIMNEVGVSM